jgi:hypothetical protein
LVFAFGSLKDSMNGKFGKLRLSDWPGMMRFRLARDDEIRRDERRWDPCDAYRRRLSPA